MRDLSMNRCSLRPGLSGAVLFVALMLAGCAAPPASPVAGGEEFNDPFENTNRAIFSFNQSVDRDVLAPVARSYRDALPQEARDSLRNFLDNLRGPMILANDVLQADSRAGDTLARFLLNSTIGLGGFIDVAGRWGFPYHDQDFGLTFAVWGIGEGPYLMVPVLGPSNPRDLSGDVAEGFADPGNMIASNNHFVWIPFVRAAVSGIDQRSRYLDTLADLERTSLDYYAAIRSLYRQRRAAQIHHQQENLPANPSLGQRDLPNLPTMATNPPATGVVNPE